MRAKRPTRAGDSGIRRAALRTVLFGVLALSGCDRSGHRSAHNRDLPPSDGEIVEAHREQAARESVSEGLECARLLGAVASARQGPLRPQVERLGLGDIRPEFAARAEERARREARDAGITSDQVDAMVGDAPAVVLDEEELRRSSDKAFSCAADVNGSHEN